MKYGIVKWQKYINKHNDYINNYLNTNGDIIIQQIIDKLVFGIENSKPEITLVGFNNSRAVCVVTKAEYYEVFDKLLKICIKLEKYEYCRIIQNNIDSKPIIIQKTKRSKRSTMVSQ